MAALHKHSRYAVAAANQAKAAKVPAKATACGAVLAPHATCTVTITITPTAAKGRVVTGHLGVQTLDPFEGTTNELASLPYAYRVG